MLRNTLVKCLAAILTTCLLSGLHNAQAGGEKSDDSLWTVDLEKAKTTAAEKNLDIMMEFTGSDWCPPCIAFHKNVLTKPAFMDVAPKNFVLLKLDSPRDKSKQTPAEIKQYRQLADQFNVRGVPTVFLADATGKPFAKKSGYDSTVDAAEYTDWMVKSRDIRKTRDKFLTAAKGTQGIARAKMLAAAIEKIDADLVISVYRDTVDEIIKLDSEGKARLRPRFANLVKLADVKQSLTKIKLAARKDVKDALGQIAQLVKDEKLTGEPLQEALYTKGELLFRTDKAASQKALEEAISAAPNTTKAEQIRSIIARFFKSEAKPKEPNK